MRTYNVGNTLEYSSLRRYFIGVKEIMHRHDVSRATAYRYLRSVPADCKIRIRLGEGRPFTMGQIIAIDRAHARAKRGNPQLTPSHQKKAAQLRWPQFETKVSEKH